MVTTAHPERLDGYAAAMGGIAAAQEDPATFVDEFYAAAMSVSGNTELRDTLADSQIPVDRKQAIIQDLLGPLADPVVVAAINFLIATGQAKYLADIASLVAAIAAAEEGSVIAEVRSAVPLDDEQIIRIAAALSGATGKDVEVRAITDPSVMGGIVAQVGDTVFDGSVRSRFDDLREQWGQ
jgi:F-type H+-transporting ATPase subunit delta